ncbi:hypothetical protein C8C85_2047 [Flavobacterium sp. 103]|uniref:hypothetical protein n=1 Tax=Flavobacterium sp. 103 TaxID=2135624 RepID=UPI000D5E5356|nr:hypothetical protein [Flavobacterium sp. 103]PVX46220.1 hypothetical protein C8C85_2047 [Flavobacterium sp. 103]
MNTNGLTKTDKMKQTIQLVKGDFTVSDASDIMMSLIDEKINFHQKQRLQKWEQNHENNLGEIEERIKQLEKEKTVIQTFMLNAKNYHNTIAINGILEISII